MALKEPLHNLSRRMHLRSRAVCCVANPRNNNGYCCGLRLAAHPDPQRLLSTKVMQRLLKDALNPPSAPLNRAMLDCLAQLPPPVHTLAVAVSGGVDSAMLAVHAAALAQQQGYALHCLHIHHGLHAHATHWEAQVQALAQLLALPCHSLRVTVTHTQHLGVEAAARQARYQGLTQLAQSVGAQYVLLGHHQNDQAETVLLRLLRGTGPQGLAAMARVTQRHGITWLRPWLHIERQTLINAAATFARATGWQAVHDPSNRDARYTRSALRTLLAPTLDARWPAWRKTLARHAQHSAAMNTVLHEVAVQDFQSLMPTPDGRSFALAAWRQLSPERQALVLRHWLAQHGLQMPTERRLNALMHQLRNLHALGHDRHLRVRHDQHWISCSRGRVLLNRLK